MNFPSWDVPLVGGGMLIGLVAILHVFVAHFAVGGGLFLVWTEARASRTNDQALLEYVKRHSSFFVLLVLVFGAVSGVGIWWTIGLVHPPATSTLIHAFVWGWAIEWVFFLVEIAAAFVYYYGWDRLDRRTHLAVGWVYFAAAWLSLFVINGILTFMLTPGRWLATRTFADGFFNPTMIPSALIRTASAVALAGLYALVTAVRCGDEGLRHRVTRYAAGWILAGAVGLAVFGPWYVSLIPPAAREISMGGAPAVTIFAGMSIGLSALIVLITMLGPLRRPAYVNPLIVGVLVALGLGVTGVTEWVREAVRKPYVIYGEMYSNGIRVDEISRLSETGVLPVAKWVSVTAASGPQQLAAGAELFRLECRSCHTIDGYNGIRLMVKGWREDFVDYQLERLSELKGFMPPFAGTPDERRALARWLFEIGRGQPFTGVRVGAPGPAASEPPAPTAAGPRTWTLPDPDPAGLPAPRWLLETLLVGTFFLHVLLMNVALGGGVVAGWAAWRGHVLARRGDVDRALRARAIARAVARLLPAATAFTITTGVAPLLFLQVLYGQLFYTSSVLMAWFWLALVGALLAGYYGYYGFTYAIGARGIAGAAGPSGHGGSETRSTGGPPATLRAVSLAVASAAVFAVVAFIFVNNMTLMLRPERFGPLYAASDTGLHANLADAWIWPRFLHMVVGALAVAGLTAALVGRARDRRGLTDGAAIAASGRRLFAGATVVQVAVGIWFLLWLPEVPRDVLLAGGPETMLLVTGIVFAIGALVMARWSVVGAAVALAITILDMTIVRDVVRRLTLAGFFSTDALAVRPQVPILVVFLVLLVTGLGTLVWMIRMLAAAPGGGHRVPDARSS